MYMENWHLNFPQFLDLTQNSGDPYLRTRLANTAVFMSDEFMKRVQKNKDWYLFDPAEVSDLPELYGAEFSKRYNEYVKMAEAGKLRDFAKIPARSSSANPDSTSGNESPMADMEGYYQCPRAQQQHQHHPPQTFAQRLHCRKMLKTPAVCNLVSINLARHLNEDKEWEWDKLEKSTRSAIRQLDNLCDITNTPIPEAMNSNLSNRALALG
jgi:ribonucleoside-diphosphate reductase alpha chain